MRAFFNLFLGLEEKEAHASAIFIILLTSIIASVFYIVNGFYKFGVGLYVGLGVVAGGVAGALLLKKLSNGTICCVFYLIMLLAGIRLLL